MRVVLIGPPASGKSRIGKKLARMLGTGFTDTDRLVVTAHGPLPELFASHGEAHFRALERAAVVTALQADGVVAFGGGAVLDPDTQRDLAAWPVVLLSVHPDAVATRLGNGKRPTVPDVETWKVVYERRRALYESLADHTVDTSSVPTEKVAAEIMEWLGSAAGQKSAATRKSAATQNKEIVP
ncbi:shikimate kinase [Herbiconiux sp. CPCC 205716]|uniref:Shikimate kinase n=1 Tax=Herbiconiux gentiana TaxID=2970912 RepID=A0ABT2GDM9_9MICO|nr:shikimate kinase [Herbiconiux gentiana]MCS5712999.1 shikimate kinase [Herbiconiux gentiana]